MELARLHPVLVHFPIALTIASCAMIWASLILKRERMFEPGLWMALLSGLSAFPAYLAGKIAEEAAEEGPAAGSAAVLLETHEEFGFITLFALTALGALAAIALWRRLKPGAAAFALAALLLACSLLVAATGWYGGRLVYEKGVGQRVNETSSRTGR